MASNFDIANLRQEYGRRGLLESELDPDPLRQFQKWLEEALAQQLLEPNAMTLATVDAGGQPWSRTVLLKGCDARGFSFYTNYEGAKGRQLAQEPRCALTIHDRILAGPPEPSARSLALLAARGRCVENRAARAVARGFVAVLLRIARHFSPGAAV